MPKLDAVLFAVAVLLGLLGVVFSLDFFTALGAQPCGSPQGGANCYPWGAEGPAADLWRYASKTTYLVSEAAFILLTIPTAALVGLKLKADKQLSAGQRAVSALALVASVVLLFV